MEYADPALYGAGLFQRSVGGALVLCIVDGVRIAPITKSAFRDVSVEACGLLMFAGTLASHHNMRTPALI